MRGYNEKAAVFFVVSFVLLEFLLLTHGSSANLGKFRSDETALFWMMLELLQAAIWGIGAFLLLSGVIKLWQEFALKLTLSTVIRALLIPLMLFFVVHKHKWNLGDYSFLTIRTASIMGYCVSFAAVGAVLIAEMALASLSHAKDSGKPNVAGYFLLRDYSQRFLLIAVATLVAGTLVSIQTAAFLLSINAGNLDAHSLVKGFGAVASIALAVFYAPTHVAFYSFGSALRDQLLGEPSPPSTADPLVEWSERRSKLESVLQLQLTTWDTLGPGISVLAPVMTGLLLGK